MEFVRTPDDRFRNLPDFPFEPHYVEINSGVGESKLRVHYLDEGPRDAKECVLCMHGQPTWCFLYRKVVPVFVAAGIRVIAPDLIGFGRSDKPVDKKSYSNAAHLDWMLQFLEAVRDESQSLTLVGQDWGVPAPLLSISWRQLQAPVSVPVSGRLACVCTTHSMHAGTVDGRIAHVS